MNKTNFLLVEALMIVIIITSCGKSYKEIKIGNQVWMTDNLNVNKFHNGVTIPESKNAEEWKKAGEAGEPAWCYYDNDPANGAKYGRLYNWYAVNHPSGLAPKGWKIPSNDDWSLLTKYLGADAGKKMKSTIGWLENGNGTNETGFNALPGGFRNYGVGFGGIGYSGYYWCGTEGDTDYGWVWFVHYHGSEVVREGSGKGMGYYVRCVRD